MKVRDQGTRRRVGTSGGLFGPVSEVDGWSDLQLAWRKEHCRFIGLGDLMNMSSNEQHHRGSVACAIVFDKTQTMVRAVDRSGEKDITQPVMFSLMDIPAGDGIAYFGSNRWTTILARRHHLRIHQGRIGMKMLPRSARDIGVSYEEHFWDMSRPPTAAAITCSALVDDRGAYVAAPFGGDFYTELNEQKGKYYLLIEDRHRHIRSVVAEIDMEIIDQGLMAPEIHNQGAPVAAGEKLLEFVGVQSYRRLRDATIRVTLAEVLKTPRVDRRGVLNPEKFSFELAIFNELQRVLTNGAIDQFRLVDKLPRRADSPHERDLYKVWLEDYRPSPNAHPQDWLPEPYVFFEQTETEDDVEYAYKLWQKTNVNFRDELDRVVYDRFMITAPVDGEVVSVEQFLPDEFGVQDYLLTFLGNDGHKYCYTIPWIAVFNDEGRTTFSEGEPLGQVFFSADNAERINLRNGAGLLAICNGNETLASKLLCDLQILLVQCLCKPISDEQVTGGRPGAMISARYLEDKEMPNCTDQWWDLRPCLPFYRDDLGCAILPRLQWQSSGRGWRDMAIHCQGVCRLDFTPSIPSRMDKKLKGTPFSVIEARRERAKSRMTAASAAVSVQPR